MMDRPVLAVLPSRRTVLALGRIVDPAGVLVHVSLHQGYADRFNAALSQGDARSWKARSDWSGCQLHNLFWENLGRPGIRVPELATRDLEEVAAEVVGSGWVCLSERPVDGEPVVHAVQGHNYPWIDGMRPLLVLDLWEHAFVGQLTDRAAYVRNLIGLVDWSVVEARRG